MKKTVVQGANITEGFENRLDWSMEICFFQPMEAVKVARFIKRRIYADENH